MSEALSHILCDDPIFLPSLRRGGEPVTGAEENPLASLTDEQVGLRLRDAKMAIRTATAYEEELKAELLTRIERGTALYVASPTVTVGDEVVQPIASVSIRHKSRSYLKYNEKKIIEELKKVVSAGTLAITGLVYTEKPKPPKERLNRDRFEEDVFKQEILEPLRELVTKAESDWIEVGGLPK